MSLKNSLKNIYIGIKMSIKNEVLKYLKENKENFTKKYGIKEIYLFGSVARGEDNIKSDIDLMIEFKDFKSNTFDNYYGFLEEIENQFKRKIDLAIKGAIKPVAFKYIKRDLINA